MTRAGASLARLGLTEPWAEDTLTQLGWWAGDRPGGGRGADHVGAGPQPRPRASPSARAERLVAALHRPRGRSTPRCAPRSGLRGRLLALLGSSTVLADHLAAAPRPLAPAARRPRRGAGGRPSSPRPCSRRSAPSPTRRPRARRAAPPRRLTGSAAVAGPAHRLPRRAAGARGRRPRAPSPSPTCRCWTSRTSPRGCRTSPPRRCGPRWPSRSPRPRRSRRRPRQARDHRDGQVRRPRAELRQRRRRRVRRGARRRRHRPARGRE